MSQGYWQFVVSRVFHYDRSIWIDGQSIALLDRFIRKNTVHLLKTKFTLPMNINVPQVFLGGSNLSQAAIFQDACAPHIAVIISSKCLLTQDYFASIEEMKVPALLLGKSEAVVKSVVFSAENIILLLESGKILLFNGSTQTWGNSSGIPQEGFIGLSSQKNCFEGVEKEVMKGVVFAWANEGQVHIVYISRNSGLSFHNISLPYVGLSDIFIRHVEIHCLFPVATFLLHGTNHDNQQKGLFLQYNLVEDEWKEQEVSCCMEPTESFFFNPPSTQFVLIWSQKSFTFGRLIEKGSNFKVKKRDNQTDFILDVNETIVSVTAGSNGDFVVLLSSNRMFYGRAFLEYVVEVSTGEDPFSEWITMFDMLAGSLLLVSVEGLAARHRKLPLKNEVLNAVYPRTSCPYLRFTTNITPELHFMDKGDEKTIWAELIHQRSTPNHIRLEISQSDVLRISTEDRTEHYQGIITQNKTFTFSYELRNGTSILKSPYKSTSVSVQLLPSVGELICENDIQILHINIGCPLSKSIVIRNCSAPLGEGPILLLSQGEIKDGPSPCHLSAALDERFKLIVDLYEGGKFVQEVLEDYIVWEETGRTEFGYSATTSEVGCLHEAQTWQKMTGNHSEDQGKAWSQSNYRSCFTPGVNEKNFDGSQSYEILNSTGLSQLVFKGSGWFHFHLRIVGTHLSFCELSTRFSVVVTGSEGKDFLPLVVSILVVTMGCTVLLYISYAHYTKQTLNRHQADEEEQQRLQELKSLFSSFQQGGDNAAMAHRRSTVNTVRRFTGTAMLMKNNLPEECLHSPSVNQRLETSNVSLKSRKSAHTTDT
ncbi:cation channel sperm-associated auxiliary subunit epsilon-like [Montipora capricornis]|uniref:cation channel sperm-associated auxiliary subunit epsilon-like n=1 Tax=Montipora capricornis TaxID=246305 RepID=UPI0035F1724E